MDGRKVLYIGVALMAAGLVLMAVSFATGDSKAGVLAIIPFFYSSSPLGGLGAILFFLGIFITIIGWWARDAAILTMDPGDDGSGGRPGGGLEDRYPPPGRGRAAQGTAGKDGRDRGGGARGGAKPDGAGPGGVDYGRQRPGKRVRGGAVVLVGPVPVVWGSDASMAKTLLIMGGVITAVLISFYIVLILV